jgi:hypothetical protein
VVMVLYTVQRLCSNTAADGDHRWQLVWLLWQYIVCAHFSWVVIVLHAVQRSTATWQLMVI